jgi:hypothetical protein
LKKPAKYEWKFWKYSVEQAIQRGVIAGGGAQNVAPALEE